MRGLLLLMADDDVMVVWDKPYGPYEAPGEEPYEYWLDDELGADGDPIGS